MRLGLAILLFVFGLVFFLCSCAAPRPQINPPQPATDLVSFQNKSEIAPPPAPGINIKVPPQLVGLPSDFFSATNLSGPWIYRTDDAFILTNADGSASDGMWFRNLPHSPQQFFMIVPVDGQYPLPANVITNS